MDRAQAALTGKRLGPRDFLAARVETDIGTVFTQLLTASVLVATAAVAARRGTPHSLQTVGDIGSALSTEYGKRPSDFRREGRFLSTGSVTTGQRKGPQPAKYFEPKTGATWCGRGPAPAWLAATKDRSKFLIAGAEADADSADAGSGNVANKKATGKKVAAKKALTAKTAG